MVSVVHCPLTLYSTFRPVKSESGNAGNGSRSARRVEVGETITSTLGSGTPGVGMKSGLPSAKPAEGRSEPFGGVNLKGLPSGVGIESVIGLKVVEPEYDIAVMSSGEARKFIVARLPSLRPGKLRLYEVKIALDSPFFTSSVRFHCPMQGR
jgi:hypothetical protein